MSVRRDTAQRISDGSAALLTAGLVLALAVAPPIRWQTSLSGRIADIERPVELSLEASPPEPVASVPKVPPPAVKPRSPDKQTQQVAAIQPPLDVMPSSELADPEAAAVVEAPASTPAPAATPSHANADLEAQYSAALRDDIDRRTHSPEYASYRARRVGGDVQVKFLVTRAGQPKGASVLRSSGSPSLDQAAVLIVSSGHYPPMPEAIFANEPEHLFAVTIEFHAGNEALSRR